MTLSDLIAKLRANEPLPICPYDRLSPKYWTAPNDKPCEFCGGLNEDGAPDKCKGADTSLFAEAADALASMEREMDQLHEGLRSRGLRLPSESPAEGALKSLDEWMGYARSYKRSLAEAREVMEVVLSADREALANHRPKWGIADCIDNDGVPYQSQYLGDALNRARAFLSSEQGGK